MNVRCSLTSRARENSPIHGHQARTRRLAAVLCGLALVVLYAAPASAEVFLHNAWGEPVLKEARFVHNVAFQGTVARIASTQIIVNPGKSPEEAVYSFDLPNDATITGCDIRLADGRTSSIAVVDSEVALKPVPDPDAIKASPDLGLLRMISREAPQIAAQSATATATYELRVFPIAAGSTATVEVSWVVPLRYDDGRLSLRIPERGDASNLVRAQVNLTLKAPAPARSFSTVHGGGKLLGKRIRGARFTASPEADIVIEAVPDFGPRASRPLVSFAAIPISGGTGSKMGAVGISVLAPKPQRKSRLSYERVVLLVDVSRSLGAEGLSAARRLADGLLGSLPAQTEVELVLFDRQAKRAFGKFQKNNGQTRKQVARALRPGNLQNGSDLGAALALASRMMAAEPLADKPGAGLERGARAATLMTIISDGMTPLSLTGRGAVDRLGEDIVQEIEVLSILLVPDSAPVPDTTRGAMAELAYETPGRAIAVRFGEADTRARSLSAEINRPAPLTNLELKASGVTIENIEMPSRLEPGQGFTAVGFYHGSVPKKLALVVEQRNKPLQLSAKRDLALSRSALALALANAREDNFIAPLERLEDDSNAAYDSSTLEEARRQLVRAANKARAVTRHSSMVALDARDSYARDRLAGIKKWGPFVFQRLAPPPEREPGYKLEKFAERHPDTAANRDQSKPTGQLDRNIIERLITTHVVPKARACYEKELRGNYKLRGSLTVVVEIARGEVQDASVVRSTFGSGRIESCVADAAFTIQVPRVALGDDQETVGVARYPLRFRKVANRGEVQKGSSSHRTIEDPTNTDDPIGGLEELER